MLSATNVPSRKPPAIYSFPAWLPGSPFLSRGSNIPYPAMQHPAPAPDRSLLVKCSGGRGRPGSGACWSMDAAGLSPCCQTQILAGAGMGCETNLPFTF